FFGHSFEGEDLLLFKFIEIGIVFNQTFFYQKGYRFSPQAYYIHCLPGYKMLNAAYYRRWTAAYVRAIMLGLSLISHKGGFAFGTLGNIGGRFGFRITAGKIYPQYLGNDLSSFFYKYGIAFPDIKFFNLIGIME